MGIGPVNTSFFSEMLQSIADRSRALILARAPRAVARALRRPHRALRGAAVRPRRGFGRGARRRDPRPLCRPDDRPAHRLLRGAGDALSATTAPRIDAAVAAWRARPSDASRGRTASRRRAAPAGAVAPAQSRARRHRRAGAHARAAARRHGSSRRPRAWSTAISSTCSPSWFNRGFLVLRRIDWSTPARDPGKDHPLRGRAPNPRLGRSAPAHRSARPALLRLLPSGAGRRAADLRRGGADAGDPGRDRADPVRQARARSSRERGDHRRVLFDHQLPARARRRELRPFPDQAGGRGGLRARCRASRPSSRCRRRRISPRGSSASAPTKLRSRSTRTIARRLPRSTPPDWWRDRRDAAETVQRAAHARGRLVFSARAQRPRHAGRPGRALPSRQRRAARAARLARRHVGARACSNRTA